MEIPFPTPGVELITQQYLAARVALRSRTDLTPDRRERLADELSDEHRLDCAQEWKSVRAQMHDDQKVGSPGSEELLPLSRQAHRQRLSPVDPEDDESDERARVEVLHEEAWELYVEAERRDLKMRQEGHLARMLGDPLPEESPEDLKRIAEGDRQMAREGLVTLMTESGESVYKPLSDLTPEDRRMRTRAEGERKDWIIGRLKKRPPASP